MIIDGFTFFNEIELLQIRLHHLWDLVDKFVIVEADRTHRGDERKFVFEEHKHEFEWAFDKLLYVRHHFDTIGQPWDQEHAQRESIGRAVPDGDPNDIIMISDVDELPSLRAVEKLPYLMTKCPTVTLKQKFHYYFFDCHRVGEPDWSGTVCCKRSHFKSAQMLRTRRHDYPAIKDGGHHFSFTGGVRAVQEKIESFAHIEYDQDKYKNDIHVMNCLDNAKDLFGNSKYEFYDVRSDIMFTPYILDHYNEYKSFFHNKELYGPQGR